MACNEPCRSCSIAGQVGACVPVPAGEDPAGHCATDPVATCKRDGSCDGSGKCRMHGAGALCLAQSCSGSTRSLAARCDGAGACVPGPTQSCAPYVCGAGGACHSMCTAAAQCIPPGSCIGGSCGQKPNGSSCAGPGECESGFCEQGACCATACRSTCKSCATAGSAGSCTDVPAGEDPLAQCPDDGAPSCARDGACNGAGACRLYAAGSQCVAPSCVSATLTLARTCDGAGVCRPPMRASCGGYRCASATSCRTSCSDNGHCDTGYACLFSTNKCTPCGGSGQVCCAGATCTSGLVCLGNKCV